MRKSIRAFILWAALLVAGVLPVHAATSVPITNFQGNWSPSTSYAAGAVVNYGGATFICLQANKNITPPAHAFKWAELPNLPVTLSTIGTSAISNLGNYPGTLILQTGPVPTTGFYFFNASALVSVDSADVGVFCYVSYGARGGSSDGIMGGLSNPFSSTIEGQASIVDYWGISVGDTAQLYCYSNGEVAASAVEDAALTVTLGTYPATGVGIGTATDPDSISNNRAEVRPQVRISKHKQ
jgi:hypothetical protein